MDFVYNALNWVGWATAVLFLVAGGYLAAGAFTEWWSRRPRGTVETKDPKVSRNTKKSRAKEKAPAESASTDDVEDDPNVTTDSIVTAKSKGQKAAG